MRAHSPLYATSFNKSLNDSLKNSTYRRLNSTVVSENLQQFRANNMRWDHKLLDKQFDEVFQSMLMNGNKQRTIFGDRAYMKIFLS